MVLYAGEIVNLVSLTSLAPSWKPQAKFDSHVIYLLWITEAAMGFPRGERALQWVMEQGPGGGVFVSAQKVMHFWEEASAACWASNASKLKQNLTVIWKSMQKLLRLIDMWSLEQVLKMNLLHTSTAHKWILYFICLFCAQYKWISELWTELGLPLLPVYMLS